MVDLSPTEEIVRRYEGDKSAVVKALQDIQEHYNYLPKEMLVRVSEGLGVPLSQVLRVATFYKAFSLEPRGKHCVDVCLGTACHVRGGARLMAKLESELSIGVGATTEDGAFSLGVVRCMGCCSMAPALRVGRDTHGRVGLDKVAGMLRTYRKDGEQ